MWRWGERYNEWSRFENYPRFMESVREVKQVDATHLHWRASIAGKEKEWDAEIVEQTPDEVIAWRSLDLARNDWTVTFDPVTEYRTRVSVRIDYEPEGVLEKMGRLMGAVSARLEGDLERFKKHGGTHQHRDRSMAQRGGRSALNKDGRVGARLSGQRSRPVVTLRARRRDKARANAERGRPSSTEPRLGSGGASSDRSEHRPPGPLCRVWWQWTYSGFHVSELQRTRTSETVALFRNGIGDPEGRAAMPCNEKTGGCGSGRAAGL